MNNQKQQQLAYKQYKALAEYIDRIGADQLNHKRFMVKVWHGKYYQEKVVIKLNDDGTISCPDIEYAPTDQEASAIAAELKNAEWPKTIQFNLANLRQLKQQTSGTFFSFIDRTTGDYIMVQERLELPDGSKHYRPWVFCADGNWVMMEPDGLLPFWMQPQPTSQKIMLHEGPKSALAASILSSDKNHPWQKTLSEYEHWGVIGGARSAHRVDYDVLKKAKPLEVVYVCDNDYEGKTALHTVSQYYGGTLKAVSFGDLFPPAFDMAEPIPANAPSLPSLFVPVTWATKNIGKTTPIYTLREEFQKEWYHTIAPEYFIHKNHPQIRHNETEFNSAVRPFSDAINTARLMRKTFANKAQTVQYNPAMKPGLYNDTSGSYVNTYLGPFIEPEKGDIQPFLELIEHLFADPVERLEVLRWIATLVCCPATRMRYGLLLISETQGVGKTSLFNTLIQLVGPHNTSRPPEHAIVESQFNAWSAHVRLVVVDEIYSGQSRKAYDRIKPIITEDEIEVNQKHTQPYKIQNWAHIAASSNSVKALHLDDGDRRWLVPKVSEVQKPEEYWNRWHTYRKAGGLSHIMHYLQTFVENHGAVNTGAHAPSTAMKEEVIMASRSAGQQFAQDIAAAALEASAHNGQRVVLLLQEVRAAVAAERCVSMNHQTLETLLTLRKVMRQAGLFEPPTRLKVEGRMQYIMATKPIEEEETWVKNLKPQHIRPEELLGM